MDQIFQASLTRAAELLNEAAASLQEAAEAAAGHGNIARGGTEYALGSGRRALAVIEACHTLQTEARTAG